LRPSAIDRNNDPKTQKHVLGSQYIVIGASDGGGARTISPGCAGLCISIFSPVS